MNLSTLAEIATIAIPIFTIVSVIVAFIVLWTKLNDRMDAIEHRVAHVEGDIKSMNPIWIDIRERLVAIETILKANKS